MSTNHTQHYQLSQWLATDKVERTDFNADNAKLDAALHALDSRAAALESVKADKTDLSTLSTAVSGKAEQSALDSLSAAVAGKASQSSLTSAVNRISSLESSALRITTGTYTGNGGSGSGSVRRLNPGLGCAPMLVLVMPQSNQYGYGLLLIQGMTRGYYCLNGNADISHALTVTWSGNSVSWYANNSTYMLNDSGVTYSYFAIG